AECDGCGSEGEEGRNVGELLLPQYALATGGLARDHRPLITFPDNNNFHAKALSEVSSKLFKEEFRFKVLVCSSVEELYEYFDRSQLTPDLGGELQYSHADWIQQRIALEKFSTLMKEISSKLDDFMHTIVDCDMGNDPTQTKELLDCQESR
ncbi:putative MCF.2 cell line derived transforming sequence-like protein, partial [Operophtera brumata]